MIPSVPLLRTARLNKIFSFQGTKIHVLKDIDLEIAHGETLGIVGESGCGKTTLGKVLLRLEERTSGSIEFDGMAIDSLGSEEMQHLRQKMQMIFQDPTSSLNPRMTIEKIVGEGLDIHQIHDKATRRDLIIAVLNQVGLDKSALTRYPHEFSGGQRQRIGIARALIMEPQFIVCDEPLSALDACTQKQVLELLLQLKKERQLAYLFISHDLHAVRAISNRIAVMYLGAIVEQGPTERIFSSPKHPYTQALLSAIPVADPKIEKNRLRIILNGDPPSPSAPPSGCPFHPRCPYAESICREQTPSKHQIDINYFVCCHKATQRDNKIL